MAELDGWPLLWHKGDKMTERAEIAPEKCPEPFWHESHRYCPICTWTEESAAEGVKKEAGLDLVALKSNHRPSRRVPEYCYSDGEPWPCLRYRLLARIEELEAIAAAARRVSGNQKWTAGLDELRAALAALGGEDG